MEKIAAILTDYIVDKKIIEKDSYEIYMYGFLTGIEMFTCIGLCLVIAFLMGMMPEGFLLLGIFVLTRSFAGGLHMNSFRACFLCSCMVFILILFAIKTFLIPLPCSLLLAFVELILICVVDPVDNINRPVDEAEMKVFSNKLRQILVIICIAAIIFYIFGAASYLNTVRYTLCSIIISMHLGRIKNRMISA